MTPTQRSLKYLRDQGYRVEVVEKWIPYIKIRKDLFGFIDLIAIKKGSGTLAIQTTSRSNVNARVNKILASEALDDVKGVGWQVIVHGWGKLKSGWTLKEVNINQEVGEECQSQKKQELTREELI